MTINFYLNNDKKSKNPEKIIFAYIREKGKTIVLHTGERINPKYWNVKKQEVKIGYTGSPELNQYLTEFKEKIQRIIRAAKIDNIDATFEDIKIAILKGFDINKTSGFFENFDNFILLKNNELSKATINKYKYLKQHLQEYEKAIGSKITFNSIDLLFYDKFSNYLMNQELINNTISKYITMLKTFLNWSVSRKISNNLDYREFHTKNDKVDIIYLSQDELNKIYELDLKDRPALDNARDVFCFACYTGQRFSDVSAIKREDIKDRFWHLRVTKTRDILKIPLNEYAKEILDKHKNDKKPLPSISSQKTNQHLKELRKLAGIDEPIKIVKYRGAEPIENTFPKYELVTMHTARRTFVTLSLEKGMRPETVMEITGHKDYKTFKKYIKITSSVKETEMNKIWSKEPQPALKRVK
jgi:integrase